MRYKLENINENDDDFRELYQSLVLEHSKKPRNFGKLDSTFFSFGKNPSCGDQITLYLDIQNNIVTDVKFEGHGCALCISSTSLLTQKIKGKSLEEVSQIISSFNRFIKDDEELPIFLEPLHIYKNIHQFPLRIKCVLLGWKALEKILENYYYGN